MHQSMPSHATPSAQRELVEQARAGSAEAFSVLARPLANRLYAIAYRILRDADQAEDATQRALIETWQHLGQLRDLDRFDAWTCRTVVRAAYREVRQLRRLTTSVRLIVEPAEGSDPASAMADRDELERGFQRLSVEHRTVLVLHHYLGLSTAEIAEAMGVPVGTVGSRIHYALAGLRAALEADARPGLAAERVTS
jgi:RNA polymerase sigma-70 factor (ECF subfamily)